MRAKAWEVVRLRGKRPIGPRWHITKDADEVSRWLAAGDNIGLVCHQRTGVLVLDPDEALAWAEMVEELGQPCSPWVITGSGRLHYYAAWTADLPAKLTWYGKIIGEIQRGPGLQQVVLPPSRHPQTGVAYRWITERLGFLCDPINPVVDPLPQPPGLWLAYLRAQTYADA